ncbi:putative glycine hydroxymethyltransferase [Helianthus annuus]|nr:putative glycine hydroxymethyltransferase [Helianthus annuus]
MSPASSLTGFSSVSSFNTFRQGAWFTPPRLFVEDQVIFNKGQSINFPFHCIKFCLLIMYVFCLQYDVVPPETSSVSSLGKKTLDDPFKKKNSAAMKISPWTLARLNAEDVSRAAAVARVYDYACMRKVCDKQKAIILADMAHISRLVATGVVLSPFEYADVLTTTTHKSLHGPRGAMIFFRKGIKEINKKSKEVSLL